MTPEAAVSRLAGIVAARAEFSEEDIYAAMAEAGIPNPVADRAFKFTQLAWGRVFLDGLGVRFSSDYLCFNGAGDVIESGVLAEEPFFAAAMGLAKQFARYPGFHRLALMSADVNALNAGSKPENLIMSSAALFLEAASPAGIEKARQTLSRRAAPSAKAGSSGSRESAPAKKPCGGSGARDSTSVVELEVYQRQPRLDLAPTPIAGRVAGSGRPADLARDNTMRRPRRLVGKRHGIP